MNILQTISRISLIVAGGGVGLALLFGLVLAVANAALIWVPVLLGVGWVYWRLFRWAWRKVNSTGPAAR